MWNTVNNKFPMDELTNKIVFFTIFNDLTKLRAKIEVKIIYLKIKDKDMNLQIKGNIQEGYLIMGFLLRKSSKLDEQSQMKLFLIFIDKQRSKANLIMLNYFQKNLI